VSLQGDLFADRFFPLPRLIFFPLNNHLQRPWHDYMQILLILAKNIMQDTNKMQYRQVSGRPKQNPIKEAFFPA
jgi:hypothetical protein